MIMALPYLAKSLQESGVWEVSMTDSTHGSYSFLFGGI